MSAPIKVTLRGDFHLASDTLTDEQLRALKNALRYPNPDFIQAERAGHAFRPPRWLTLVRRKPAGFEVPRAGLGELQHIAGGVHVEDLRALAPHDFTIARPLRAEQEHAAGLAVEATSCLVVAPPGFGKTSTALGAIARAGQRALVLAPTVDLMMQWHRETRTVLREESGVFGGGRQDLGRPITIATYAAVRDDETRARLFADVGTLVVDEAHNAAAPGIVEAIRACPARYRFGFTATPHTDHRGYIVRKVFGPIVYRAETARMVDAGRLVPARLRQVPTTFETEQDQADFSALVGLVVADRARNALIVRTVIEGSGLAIVITSRVAHAQELAAALADRGLRAGCLVGEMKRADREAALEQARAGELDVITATQLADEGLDLPNLRRVLLAAPAREGARFIQRVGRGLRTHHGKEEAEIVDFVDVKVGLLRYQARKRHAAFHALFAKEIAS